MEGDYGLLGLGAFLYCEVGFAENTNLTCVDLFHIAWRPSVAVCYLIIRRILTLIPAQPVQKVPKRMNHKPSSATSKSPSAKLWSNLAQIPFLRDRHDTFVDGYKCGLYALLASAFWFPESLERGKVS